MADHAAIPSAAKLSQRAHIILVLPPGDRSPLAVLFLHQPSNTTIIGLEKNERRRLCRQTTHVLVERSTKTKEAFATSDSCSDLRGLKSNCYHWLSDIVLLCRARNTHSIEYRYNGVAASRKCDHDGFEMLYEKFTWKSWRRVVYNSYMYGTRITAVSRAVWCDRPLATAIFSIQVSYIL